MNIIIVILAITLAWFFIEITLFIVNRINFGGNSKKRIVNKKFIWSLRMLLFSLFSCSTVYMYIFQNLQFQQAIQYCLGVIK